MSLRKAEMELTIKYLELLSYDPDTSPPEQSPPYFNPIKISSDYERELNLLRESRRKRPKPEPELTEIDVAVIFWLRHHRNRTNEGTKVELRRNELIAKTRTPNLKSQSVHNDSRRHTIDIGTQTEIVNKENITNLENPIDCSSTNPFSNEETDQLMNNNRYSGDLYNYTSAMTMWTRSMVEQWIRNSRVPSSNGNSALSKERRRKRDRIRDWVKRTNLAIFCGIF